MELQQILTLIWFFTITTILAERCDIAEKRQLKEKHMECTQTVQQRYSILTIEPESQQKSSNSKTIRAPMIYNTGDQVSGLNQQQVCAMIEETVKGCASIYDHCFSDTEKRVFQDSQLQIISEIMTHIYNMGPVVAECELMQEFKRSGREGMVLPTEKCNLQEVHDISKSYQECIEGANDNMNQEIIKQNTVDKILDVLCDGMNIIVHDCSYHLQKCYSEEEINETKIGQLELTKQIFKDIVSLRGDNNDLILDLNKCSAYSNMQLYLNASPRHQTSAYAVLFSCLYYYT